MGLILSACACRTNPPLFPQREALFPLSDTCLALIRSLLRMSPIFRPTLSPTPSASLSLSLGCTLHQVVLAAVRQDGAALEFASDRLRNDSEATALNARRLPRRHRLRLHPLPPLSFFSARLARIALNFQFVSLSLSLASLNLPTHSFLAGALFAPLAGTLFLASVLGGASQVVLAAVASDEDALGEASFELRGQKNVVLAAVSLNGLALE